MRGGYALAGAFPADVNENRHFLGALLVMGMGNIGLLLAGLVWRRTALWAFCVGAMLLVPSRDSGELQRP